MKITSSITLNRPSIFVRFCIYAITHKNGGANALRIRHDRPTCTCLLKRTTVKNLIWRNGTWANASFNLIPKYQSPRLSTETAPKSDFFLLLHILALLVKMCTNTKTGGDLKDKFLKAKFCILVLWWAPQHLIKLGISFFPFKSQFKSHVHKRGNFYLLEKEFYESSGISIKICYRWFRDISHSVRYVQLEIYEMGIVCHTPYTFLPDRLRLLRFLLSLQNLLKIGFYSFFEDTPSPEPNGRQ